LRTVDRRFVMATIQKVKRRSDFDCSHSIAFLGNDVAPIHPQR